MKEKIQQFIDGIGPKLVAMSDEIYDLAELSGKKYQSSKLLVDCLKENGFQVECGVGGMETSFRAVYEQGNGGPSFGLLAEYDALSMGHGCGHHMQGPAIIGAALCIKELAGDIGVNQVRVVANKVRDARDEEYIKARIPAQDLLGFIHYNPDVIEADRGGKSPYDFSPAAVEEIRAIKARMDSEARH